MDGNTRFPSARWLAETTSEHAPSISTALRGPPAGGAVAQWHTRARNSTAETNLGPTFTDLRHQPVVPAANQPVTVSAGGGSAGIATARLYWSRNGGAGKAGRSRSRPGIDLRHDSGAAAGTVVQFYVAATDSQGASASFRPGGRIPGRCTR